MSENALIWGPAGMEREAVKRSVELTGEFRAVTGSSLREAQRRLRPASEVACVLQMHGTTDAAAQIRTLPDTAGWRRFLVETAEVPDAWLIEGLRNGAVAVIAWPCLVNELRTALEAARRGLAQLTPRAGGLLAGELRCGRPRHLWELKLTARERQVVRILRAGATNKEIAARLGIAVATVERHLTCIYRRLGVQCRTEAVLHLRRQPGVAAPAEALSPLDQRIVAGVLGGLGNDAIADQLGLSRHTIEAHLTRAFLRHRVRNRLELIAKLTGAT